jgi:type II secretory pathway component PulL
MSDSAHILFANESAVDAHQPEPVVLALPSSWCLSATIDTTGLPRADRRALVFRLEDKLPVAAEDVTADVVMHGAMALGVCARNERLHEMIAGLESRGIEVRSIAPAALLAAQASVVNPGTYVLLIGLDSAVDVVAVENGAPIAWAWSAANADDVRLQIDLVSSRLKSAPRLLAIGIDELALECSATKLDRNAEDRAAATARRVVEGRVKPWIELRRDTLAPADRSRAYRRALNFALASASLLLLATATASIVRSVRYDRAARDAEFQMNAAFQEHFPGWPVPANVRAVVESEARKGGEQSGDRSRASALQSMRTMLSTLPSQVKISIDSMSFDTNAFEISGKVNAQSDLQAIADAMRAARYEVPAGVNRRESDGTWSFTLSGTRSKKDRSGAIAQQR